MSLGKAKWKIFGLLDPHDYILLSCGLLDRNPGFQLLWLQLHVALRALVRTQPAHLKLMETR